MLRLQFYQHSRERDRGAHQRSDFPNLDPVYKFNYLVSMDKKCNLKIKKVSLNELSGKLKSIVANAKREEDFRNKLLE